MQYTQSPGSYTLQPSQGTPKRSPGIHLSGVLSAVARKLGVFKEEDLPLDALIRMYEGTEPGSLPGLQGNVPLLNRIALGLALEDWLAPRLLIRYPGLIYHPGELCEGRVTGSVDGIDPDNSATHEIKLTWISARRPLEEHWYWLHQARAYCHLWHVRRTFLHVFSVNGNYTYSDDRGGGPQLTTYDIHFEPKEISATWRMIQTNHDLATPEGQD